MPWLECWNRWAGVLEKLTQKKGYDGVKLVLGNISAPRGGCLSGRHGRRGHVSHTNGQDVDLGFLVASEGKPSPLHFHRKFDPKVNWPLIKKIFENKFACVKVIFLDQRHISTLSKHAKQDKAWQEYGRFIRPQPGHKDHFHVRIGKGPGLPGCGSQPELETEDYNSTFASGASETKTVRSEDNKPPAVTGPSVTGKTRQLSPS